MAPTESPTEPDPPWPTPRARMIGLVAGIGLVAWEAAVEHSAHLVVYGIAFLLTGLPIAKGLEILVDWIKGTRS